jgi:hypothetical protein
MQRHYSRGVTRIFANEDADEDADFRGLRTRMGYVFFHGVDAKIVGATGKSPLRYQNIHLTMMGTRIFADFTRIFAD